MREISIEAFTNLCCIRDAQGKITDFEWTYANPAAGRILKQQTEKLVGRRLLEVLPGNREKVKLDDGVAFSFSDIIQPKQSEMILHKEVLKTKVSFIRETSIRLVKQMLQNLKDQQGGHCDERSRQSIK